MSEPYYEALPSALKPVHYDVSIKDITDTTYTGTVDIQLKVQKPTDELHLHFRDLTISHASAAYNGETVAGSVSEENVKKEFFVLKFAKEFSSGELVVSIAFSGKIQTNMAGFYKSSYTENGETKYMLSTQFEATDARRAFPCLDEPALKATFTVHITTDANLCVLGNMPVAEEKVSGSSKTVTFEKTPVMSTYLLAWAVGDFEYIESYTQDKYQDGKPLPVRIYTTPGYAKDAQLASEIAPKIVDYFSKVFEVKYPLPKLDLIAVHAFSHNAMENWGLITYRSTALLYSEETSDPSYKQKVAYVVAHEIAHQWFGNLVTMEWWDELWLNEGFATWVGFYAVDYLFPEWDIFAGFVSTSLQEALRLDGLRNSHPIKVPVMDALDIDQLFDVISYLKGASTILMLSTYLTTEVFLKGVAKYLNENKFANATSDDLWSAISDVAGKDVSAMMESWITKIGFPVVDVAATDDGLHLSQSRFLNGGGVKPEEDETVWWVPLNLSTDSKSITVDSFSEKELRIAAVPKGLFKLNKDTDAPFRVNYAPNFLQDHILAHFKALSAKDVVGVIADVFSVAVSGDSKTSTTTFLDMVKLITLDNDYLGTSHVVWTELCSRLTAFSTTFKGQNEQLTQQVTNFCSKVCEQVTLKLKNETIAKEDFLTSKLRSDMLKFTSAFGIPQVTSYGRELFESWKAGKKVDPSLRYFMFSCVVSDEKLTREDFDTIVKVVTHPDSLDSREVALSALGNIANPDLVPVLLSYLADESIVPTMDAHFLAVPLSKNVKFRDQFWQYFKQNYAVFHKNMSTNMVVLDRFVKLTLCNYQSTRIEQEVKEFFSDKDVHGFERALNQVLDQIKIRAAWCERDQAKVAKWLSDNGF